MKKLLYGSALCLVFHAQAQQRMVLVEGFSQASCNVCITPNANLHALLIANPTKAIGIKYPVGWPGFDPMYMHNPPQLDHRVWYYGIGSIPDRVLDGTNMDVTQTSIDNRFAVSAPVAMTISHTLNPGYQTVNINVTITAPSIWNPTNSVLQLAMIEEHIEFAVPPGSNGETEFYNVVRKLIPNVNGSPIVASNFAAPGGSQTFTFNNIDLPSYLYDLNEIGFVAWVQNDVTKEVYQAGASPAYQLSDFGLVRNLGIPDEYNCDNDISNLTGTIFNMGSSPITSANIEFSVNDGSPQTLPFSGNIASGSSFNFTLPTIPVINTGTQNIEVYLTNINNSGISIPIGKDSISLIRLSTSGSTGMVQEDFANSDFPYNAYYLTSPTNDHWEYHSGANNGALFFENYFTNPGNFGEVYLAPIDLSGSTNKFLKFDVAYCVVDAFVDELEVLVSNDCEVTWTSVYIKEGSVLATIPAQLMYLIPDNWSQWRNETIDLTQFGNSDQLIIKFKATSGFGNNLYIDNINVGGSLAVIEQDLLNVHVYPNPTTGMLNVTFEANGSYDVTVTDLTGRVVANAANASSGVQAVEFDTTKFSEGSYVVTIMSNGVKTIKNVVVQ